MTRYILAAAIFCVLLAQLSGCHFYIDAVPRFIFSDQEFSIPPPVNNYHPNPPPPTNENTTP